VRASVCVCGCVSSGVPILLRRQQPQCTQNVNIQNKAPEYSTSYLGSDLYKNAVPETQCSLPYYGNRLIKPKTPLQYSSALHIQTTTTETITSSPPSAQHFYGNFNG